MDAGTACIQFYGASLLPWEEKIRPFRCYPLIEVHPRVPYKEMVRLQQQAAVLLLLSCAETPGVMTGKIFDYLAARRPVLDVPGGDVTKALLLETGAGASGGTPEEIAAILLEWYKEWKRTGTVPYHVRAEKVGQYSRRQQAGQLAAVFDRLRRG